MDQMSLSLTTQTSCEDPDFYLIFGDLCFLLPESQIEGDTNQPAVKTNDTLMQKKSMMNAIRIRKEGW
jgi:hypothetical protein